MWRYSAVVIFAAILRFPGESAGAPRQQTIQSGGHSVRYDIFGSREANAPILIFLHGSSGPDVGFYQSQAAFFAENGYEVLLLHYFDSTRSSQPSDRNYHLWVQALADLIRECGVLPSFEGRPIFLVGDSLGASVALAGGSQGIAVRAIAEWYGSLPDEFFYHFKTMPPLLILHGALDTNIPLYNAQQLVKLCGIKQLVCESHFYSDQHHGFVDDALRDAEQRTLRFFKGH